MDDGAWVVTGGNAGLGLECARALLADDDRRVVLACRDPGRGAEAARALGERASTMSLDLASLASVRAFAHAARRELPPLRGLVCNAGVQVVNGVQRTQDGFEATFGVNHLGHFLLVRSLLDHIAPGGRVIVVSSGTHDPAQRTGMPAPRWTDPRWLARPELDPDPTALATDAEAGRRRYTTSKLANLLFVHELHRRLRAEGSTITALGFDPGMMPGSGLARDYPAWQRVLWRWVLPVLRWFAPNVHSTEESGRALARLATDPLLATVSGRYFEGTREREPSAESQEPTLAAALWQASEALTLTPHAEA